MKILAKELKCSVQIARAQISFDCSPKAKQTLERLKQGEYVVTIEKARNTRTLNQNAFIWAIIGEICEVENGARRTEDEERIYTHILTDAGAACTYLQCIPEAIKELKQYYRVVEPVERRGNSVICKCYKGISDMDTAQASKVVEAAQKYAEMVGIDTDAYERIIEWKE